jgi:hypothetical protein
MAKDWKYTDVKHCGMYIGREFILQRFFSNYSINDKVASE